MSTYYDLPEHPQDEAFYARQAAEINRRSRLHDAAFDAYSAIGKTMLEDIEQSDDPKELLGLRSFIHDILLRSAEVDAAIESRLARLHNIPLLEAVSA
jgi:hypothetical protein